ncbi:hypothetical protein BGV52_04805 [Burkholderia ubonensis]|uniref:DUF2827 domain-containing protein n=1 Tax=Burkholderia ubonensis TaxID=101571 RepID=UPI0008FDB835|nr:DUF2827 domain-containing protein [Burkholderia ubonensis]OJB11880.1 hypothetical protein BGV52_04805 [Burkholderia ubonensis]OJB70215.1 hypothetical protein BGV61_02340 [Burkholderia ubonensis]
MLTRRLKVGITIFLRKGNQSIWENGIFQNCFFLAMLLKRSPFIDEVYLVNGGDGSPSDANQFLELAPAPTIDLDSAREKLDVLIELSAQLNPDWARAFKDRGGRVIGMRVANDYVIDIERMMFDLPHGMLVSGTPYSAIWTLPAFERTCASYYETALRAPVRAMQHLWSPQLLERSIAAGGAAGKFGYEPGRSHWRLAILEPNICMVKTSHLAMLTADVAYRQAPDMIDYLRVYNTLHLKDDAQFVGFARSLDLVNHGRATFEPRLPIYSILGPQADAVVSHQWENAQNYLYYEALHGGYPLIHNSPLLDGCGYRYDGFDCEDGALALREAFLVHDLTLDAYRSNVRAFLAKLDPERKENVDAYGAAVAEVFQR